MHADMGQQDHGLAQIEIDRGAASPTHACRCTTALGTDGTGEENSNFTDSTGSTGNLDSSIGHGINSGHGKGQTGSALAVLPFPGSNVNNAVSIGLVPFSFDEDIIPHSATAWQATGRCSLTCIKPQARPHSWP